MNQSGIQAPGSFATLAGQFLLQPGQGDAIVGTRPIAGAGLLSQLLKGQPFAATQARLGHVFTLCAHAHQRACALAFAAAWPERASAAAAGSAQTPASVAPSQSRPHALPLALLRWETARDHLRTIALDWPQRLGDSALQQAGLQWLQACPMPLSGGTPASAQAAWDSLAALNTWLADSAAFPAQCLERWQAKAQALEPVLRPLNLLCAYPSTQRAHLHRLGQCLAAEPGFAQRPQWLGACAETGPWTRLRHQRWPAATLGVNAWSRLAARWLELLEIAATPALADDAGYDPLLSSGAQNLGDGQAIAWCEMARGLLLHWVQLDAQGAVAQYRVLAPTEWNFHPQGALAQALAALDAQSVAAAQTLAAAFDPCVECSVATPPTQEPLHA